VRTIDTGTVLSGRYRLDRPPAPGAPPPVGGARDVELGRSVALKLLDADGSDVDPELADRFLREGRILGRLVHPNIVPVLAAGDDGGRPYLVMALIDGPTLRERLAGGPLPIDDAVAVVTAIAAGLAEAHRRGVIHRDVKPGNVVCGEDGQPRLVDFGIARASDLTTMTKADAVLGTAAYLAPEQALGDELGPATDVYALGCVLFELLTGAPPFPAASAVAVAYRHVHDPAPMPNETRPEVPGALAAIVGRCLAKQPGDRYRDAGELEAALTRWRSGDADEPTGALTVVTAAVPDATTVLPATPADPTGVLPAYSELGAEHRTDRRAGRRAVAVVSALVAAIVAVALIGFVTDPGGSSSSSSSTTSTTSVAPTTTAPPPTTAAAAAADPGGNGGSPGKGKGKGGKD
jgi:serine/threonine protein kinase